MSLITIKNPPWADERWSLLFTHFQHPNFTLVLTESEMSRTFAEKRQRYFSETRDKRLPAPSIDRHRRQVTWPLRPLRNYSICVFFSCCFFPLTTWIPSQLWIITPGDRSRDMNRIELVETHSTSWQRDSVSTKNNEKKKEGKKVTWTPRHLKKQDEVVCRFLSFWPNCGWNCRPALILNGKWRSFMPLKPAWARAS